MHDAIDRFGVFFADGVEQLLGRGLHLARMWHDLSSYWIVRIVRVNQVEKVGCDRQCQLIFGKQATCALVGCQFEVLLELLQLGNPIFELPLPVVPLFGGHIRPVALAAMPICERVVWIHEAGK